MLKRGKKAIAKLRPVSRGGLLGELPALFTSLPRLSFKEALEFEKDLRAGRGYLGQRKINNPWAF